jgi:SAM-dependent methyltransferase
MAERLRWAFLALVPSSLLLSVTTYLTTDIAAAPFLWVAPLALYLLTYVLAFARRPWLPGRALALALPVAVMVPILAYLVRVPVPARLFVPVHLAVFFLAAASCHRELAARRPAPDWLTEYYVWVSVGGVLGGAFNTLVAPLVFTLPAEYPLGLVLACLARPVATGVWQPLRVRWLWALPLGVAGLVLLLPIVERAVGVEPRSIEGLALTFGLPLLVCGALWPRPAVFALGLTAVLVAGSRRGDLDLLVLSRVRTFFGVHQVMRDPAASLHLYLHGTTLHGAQATWPDDRREPLSYFRRDGPIGELLRGVGEARPGARVAVVGLGIGTLAAYATPGQRWTFFEIDPSVERIARDPRFFTYLADAPTPVEVVLGDARLSLVRARPEPYDVIVLDAFSSDAVPVHLLTREAIELYLARLRPGGVLAFNITNRHVELEGVLGALAHALSLASAVRHDRIEDAGGRPGLFPSRWLLMARRAGDLGPHVRSPLWHSPVTASGQAVWTDDRSSLVPVLRWGAAP